MGGGGVNVRPIYDPYLGEVPFREDTSLEPLPF